MKIKVCRDTFTDNTTISKIYVDDTFVCFGLEDKVMADNEKKIYGATAVPYGVYQVQFRKEGTIYESLCKRDLGINKSAELFTYITLMVCLILSGTIKRVLLLTLGCLSIPATPKTTL